LGVPTKINVIPASAFVVATGHGEVDFAETRTQFMKIMKAAALVPDAHVLVDVREARSQMKPFEVFSLVTVFNELKPPFSGRLAIVNRPKDDFDRAGFFSLAAQVQGFQVAAFQDFEQAVRWLYPPHPVDTEFIHHSAVPRRTDD
jgi:hypothetical protein